MNLVRRACFFVTALVVLQQSAFAQNSAPSTGIMVGLNESHYASSPKNEGKTDPGVTIGAFAVFLRDKAFKIQPEVQFAEHRDDVAFGGSFARYSINYINLGLM